MTDAEITDLLDLYVDNELPEALRASVETYLAAHPQAAQEVRALQETAARLKSAPNELPDPWFVERALDSLLREHAGAHFPGQTVNFGNH